MVNSNEYMRNYMKKRYQQRRQMAYDYLGGVCVVCSSDKNLEIDHINREDKTHNRKFVHYYMCALDRFYKELNSCQLLCEDCHREKTNFEMGVEHGGGLSGKKNCPCGPCKARKAEYMRNRYKDVKDEYNAKRNERRRLERLMRTKGAGL